jgi:hypothetical protein
MPKSQILVAVAVDHYDHVMGLTSSANKSPCAAGGSITSAGSPAHAEASQVGPT